MNGHHAVKSFAVLFVFSLFISFALFSGCEKTTEKIVTEYVYDTVEVPIVMITIEGIDADPDSITQGGTITLTVNVTKDASVGDLTFSWTAENGELHETEGDTVSWTSPDEEGAYKIEVTATDGEYAGVGSRVIGVGMYAPTADPYYVGGNGSGCGGGTCHGTIVDAWAQTAHAHAWATLQESGHPASYCNPCHTVGYEGTAGNSGYDEAPIAKFENVQCENCHGPASDHPNSVSISYDAMNCGKCHEGEHHPYMTEWEESAHAFDLEAAVDEFGGSPNCWGCHEGVASAIRLSGDLSSFYGSGAVSSRPDTTEVPFTQITCQVCHDSHSNENVGQLITVADVKLVTANGESPIIADGGTGKLCMQCHHARRSPDNQVLNGNPSRPASFGPHESPQGDMAAGKSGYHGVAPSGFNWAGASHLYVQNSCKTCHLNMVEWSPSGPAVTGHKFEPTTLACQNCHGTISDFGAIPAADDFDGDGSVEGLQHEVEGLLTLLTDALIADGLDTTGVGIVAALGDSSNSTQLQREAGYNLVFVEADHSLGVHNPDYAIQLLQQSYLHLTGTLPKNMAIVEGDDSVVMNW